MSQQRNRSTRWLRGAVSLAAAVGLLAGGLAPAGDGDPRVRRVALQVPATDLAGIELGTDWINTSGPIRARDLRGKVVLLDFWTFCCINCHHILPDLAYLEEKYKNELVVIGVHSPKFPAEQDLDNVRNKVHEYRIKHPVINDANQAIWNAYNVSSWPTLLLFDANGNQIDPDHPIRGELGAHGRKQLDLYIGKLIAHHRARKELDETPIRFFPEAEKSAEGPLNYPGKVLADPHGKRLFISDTGNNRIVVADLRGKLIATIGGGATGLADGSYDKAMFNRPQGTCLHDGVLYVADTENHAIRAVDLKAEQVKTIAGTGKQAHLHRANLPARDTALSSPWDVLALSGTRDLYIAMAGPHQIWKLDLERDRVGVWAGTGDENIRDGSLEAAMFAQPSGLATDGKMIYVADSETSSVREIAIHPTNNGRRVQTIVGRGLFVFGDEDGQGPNVRLQHDLGLAFGGGKLYIADSYNNKIKVCEPKGRSVAAVAGSPKAEAGSSDSPPLFNQPGGLSLAGTTLYVADTNNHKIRTIDLSGSVPKVKTLPIEGLTALKPPPAAPKFLNRTTIAAPATRIAPGQKLVLDVKLTLPADIHLNADTPMPYLIEAPKRPEALTGGSGPAAGRIRPPAPSFELTVPLAQEYKAGESLDLKLSVSTFQCRGGSEGYCMVKSYAWTIPVTFADGGPERIRLTNVEETAAK